MIYILLKEKYRQGALKKKKIEWALNKNWMGAYWRGRLKEG